MGKNYKEYLEGFDMELLASALRRGEKFNGVEERVDMNCTGKSSCASAGAAPPPWR